MTERKATKDDQAKMNMKPVKTAEEARDKAIQWQIWASDKSLYMSELVDWMDYFTKLGRQFNLTDEFEENGII